MPTKTVVSFLVIWFTVNAKIKSALKRVAIQKFQESKAGKISQASVSFTASQTSSGLRFSKVAYEKDMEQ